MVALARNIIGNAGIYRLLHQSRIHAFKPLHCICKSFLIVFNHCADCIFGRIKLVAQPCIRILGCNNLLQRAVEFGLKLNILTCELLLSSLPLFDCQDVILDTACNHLFDFSHRTPRSVHTVDDCIREKYLLVFLCHGCVSSSTGHNNGCQNAGCNNSRLFAFSVLIAPAFLQSCRSFRLSCGERRLFMIVLGIMDSLRHLYSLPRIFLSASSGAAPASSGALLPVCLAAVTAVCSTVFPNRLQLINLRLRFVKLPFLTGHLALRLVSFIRTCGFLFQFSRFPVCAGKLRFRSGKLRRAMLRLRSSSLRPDNSGAFQSCFSLPLLIQSRLELCLSRPFLFQGCLQPCLSLQFLFQSCLEQHIGFDFHLTLRHSLPRLKLSLGFFYFHLCRVSLQSPVWAVIVHAIRGLLNICHLTFSPSLLLYHF